MRTWEERGFTLIELLVTVALTGIVTAAVGNALIGFIRNTDAATHQLTASRGALSSAQYFAQDVSNIGVRQNAGGPQRSIDTTGAAGSPLACGTVGTPVVRFGWDIATSFTENNQLRVAYVVIPVPIDGASPGDPVQEDRQLHRVTCVGPEGKPSDVLIAHHLTTSGPLVTCALPSDCNSSAVPQRVTMVFTIKDPGAFKPVVVTLTGQRRQTL